jgi:hypothetical protein
VNVASDVAAALALLPEAVAEFALSVAESAALDSLVAALEALSAAAVFEALVVST